MVNEMKSRLQEWMAADIRGDLKRLGRWVRRRRTAILVVIFWSVAIGLILIKAYWLLYATTPILWDPGYRLAYAPTYSRWIPRLSETDYLIILSTSLVAGFIISDIKTTLFGFLASVLLSSSIGIAYSALFIWYILDFGSVFGSSFISLVVLAAFLNIFRMIFPVSILATFFGGIFGSVIRGLIQPSAQD